MGRSTGLQLNLSDLQAESLGNIKPGCHWFPEWSADWKTWAILNLAVTDFLSDLQTGKSGPYWTWLIVTDFLSVLQAGKSGPYWTWLSMISWVTCKLENRGHIKPGCHRFPEWLEDWKVWVKRNLVGWHWLGAGFAQVTPLPISLLHSHNRNNNGNL